MEAKVTLKRISELLNISISTVSRALINHPDIALSTRQKVKELAEMLEYEPNTYAINLRTNTSKVFGVIVPRISNYFYDSFNSAVEEEARKAGYTLMVLQTNDDPQVEITSAKLCKANRAAGIFICISPNTQDLSTFKKIEEAGTPIVFFDKVPDNEDCNKVCFANKEVATKAAELIIAKNKKNVLAIFGNKNLSISKERSVAFKTAFEQCGKKIKLTIEYTNNAQEAEDISRLLLTKGQKPDTIFCMSDEILTGVMKTVQKLEITLPQKLSVIAMSNGFIPTLYYPEITFIKTSGYDLGKLAYNKMVHWLNGSKVHESLNTGFEIVEGGSF